MDYMALAGWRSCQGRTQYCELLTCVLVSLTPQVSTDHIDEAVEEEEDMKYRNGEYGVSIITFQIFLRKSNFYSNLEHFKVPRTISPVQKWSILKGRNVHMAGCSAHVLRYWCWSVKSWNPISNIVLVLIINKLKNNLAQPANKLIHLECMFLLPLNQPKKWLVKLTKKFSLKKCSGKHLLIAQ